MKASLFSEYLVITHQSENDTRSEEIDSKILALYLAPFSYYTGLLHTDYYSLGPRPSF
jgi:hypothetical protein